MRSKRNRKGTQGKGISSIVEGIRQAFTQHIKKNSAPYAPALSPIVFFLLAHIITLLALIFMQAGMLPKDQVVCKTIVTWAVYGFLPLLLCSYVSFYFIARPVAGVLERKFPLWSEPVLNLSSGAAYGVAIGLFLVLLLNPNSGLSAFLVLLIGIAAGQGNWFFYRKLVRGDA